MVLINFCHIFNKTETRKWGRTHVQISIPILVQDFSGHTSSMEISFPDCHTSYQGTTSVNVTSNKWQVKTDYTCSLFSVILSNKERGDDEREDQELNNRMCCPNIESESRSQTFMLYIHPNSVCVSSCVKLQEDHMSTCDIKTSLGHWRHHLVSWMCSCFIPLCVKEGHT